MLLSRYFLLEGCRQHACSSDFAVVLIDDWSLILTPRGRVEFKPAARR